MPYEVAAGPNGGGLVALSVLVALFVGLSVAAGYGLFLRGRPTGRRARWSTAQRLLDERLARGEIDEQKYLRLSADLWDVGPSPRRGGRPMPDGRRRRR